MRELAQKRRVVGILGLGIFGSTIAKELAENGIEVIACDKDPINVNRLDGYLTVGSVGDFTDIDYMRQLGFDQCDAVVISTATSLESSVLGVINCKELGIQRVICKAKNKTNRKVLYALGVDKVVLPEKDSGMYMAKTLMRNTIEEIVKLDEDTSIVEFHVPQAWVGKTLDDLDLRQRYDMNIIGIRQSLRDTLTTNFPADYIIQETDILVGISDNDKFERADYLQSIR